MPNKKFQVPINLVNLSSDPVSGAEGDIYYNTTNKTVKAYANGAWTEVGKLTQEQVQDYVAPLFVHNNHINAVVTYEDAVNEIHIDVQNAPSAGYTSAVKHAVKLNGSIAKGQAVYVSSANGTNMIVSKASNVSEATSSKTMGLLETGGVNNAIVNVVSEGLLAGLDTSTAGAEGDPVWLGTDGNLIYGLTNKPYAPAHLVFIGVVTRKNQNNGEIFVKVQNGFELWELHNVQLDAQESIADKEVLAWDQATSLWKNQTASEAGLATSTHNHNGTYEPVIEPGTTSQYWRGDKTWQTLDLTPYAQLSGATFTGDIGVDGGDITTTSSTATLFNSNATTVNIGGQASTVSIGDLLHNGTTTIQNDLYVAGNITFGGSSTTLSATNLDITDSLIYLAVNNAADILDIGFVGAYVNNATHIHTGFARDASDGKWKLFSGITAEPTTYIDFTGATYDTLKIGALEVTDASTTRSNLGLTIGTNVQAYSATLAGITSTQVSNWDTAYGWGNHANAGYLTSSSLTPYLTSSAASNTYEPKITAGTTAQYLRGDKSLATFPTALTSFTNDLSVYLGTTQVSLNRSSGSLTLNGVSISGNAGTVTNGIYTTDTGTVTSTMILNGTIVDDDINSSAGIVDTKLATIATAGKVSNSATTATSANTVSAIVSRDASGNFSAGTITASGITSTGNVSSTVSDNTVSPLTISQTVSSANNATASAISLSTSATSSGGTNSALGGAINITTSATQSGVNTSSTGGAILIQTSASGTGTLGSGGGNLTIQTTKTGTNSYAGTITISSGGSFTISSTNVGTLNNFNIGSTTPGTGNFTSIGATSAGTGTFTTLTASSLSSSSSGTISFPPDGGTLSTTSGFNYTTSLTSVAASTTLQPIFGSGAQALTIKANTLYFVEGALIVTRAASASAQVKFGFTFSNAQQSIYINHMSSSNSATGATLYGSTANSTASITTGPSGTTATGIVIRYQGYFVSNATTGGTITPGFGQTDATGATTNMSVASGAWIKLTPISGSGGSIVGAWA